MLFFRACLDRSIARVAAVAAALLVQFRLPSATAMSMVPGFVLEAGRTISSAETAMCSAATVAPPIGDNSGSGVSVANTGTALYEMNCIGSARLTAFRCADRQL
ncbi:MAG: hypothetical protein PGN12_16445 [Sphingomonas phyllosphaerae]